MELPPEEASELEKEMQDYEFKGIFHTLDFMLQKTFEGRKLDVLESVVDRYKLEENQYFRTNR